MAELVFPESPQLNDEYTANGATWIYNGTGWIPKPTALNIVQVGDAAAVIGFTPSGDIAATDVQTAIEELDTEKLAKSGGTLTNYKETRYAVTTTGNVTINLANGNIQRFILDANRQFTMPADPGDVGQSFVLIIECATFTPTWNSSPAIKWLSIDGTAPTLVTTANFVNVLTFLWDDTDSRWLGWLAGSES